MKMIFVRRDRADVGIFRDFPVKTKSLHGRTNIGKGIVFGVTNPDILDKSLAILVA